MAGHDIIVVGASAGGMEALRALVRGLPPDLPAALFVVWHMPAHSFGVLPDVIGRAGLLPAAHARDGEPIEPGRVYVAPPDWHVLLTSTSTLALSRGPKMNWTRPAADVLFNSVAAASKDRAIGVILTGYGRGGHVISEDPATCEASSMPVAAIGTRSIDFVLPIDRIAPALVSLCMVPGAADLFGVASSATAHLPYDGASESPGINLGDGLAAPDASRPLSLGRRRI